MRPDDQEVMARTTDPARTMPLDADLQALHGELEAAGAQARRALHGRTQPTRVFSNDLRARLVAAAMPAPTHPTDGFAMLGAAPAAEPDRGLEPRSPAAGAGERGSTQEGSRGMPPRTRRSLIAVSLFTLVLAAAAAASISGATSILFR
jgi:hypothetical protein